jgi:hypothetical protein
MQSGNKAGSAGDGTGTATETPPFGGAAEARGFPSVFG